MKNLSAVLNTRWFKITIALIVLVVVIAFAAWWGWNHYGKTIYEDRQLLKAEDAFNENDLTTAILVASAVVQSDPTNVNALVQLSLYLSQKGSLEFKEKEFGEKAIVVAKRAIELDGNNSEAWRALGYAHEILQNYYDAHAEYGVALSHDSSNVRAMFGDGHVYDLEGKPAEAEQNYRNAIKVEPGFVEAHAGLGRVLVSQNKLDDAVSEFLIVYNTSKSKHVKAEAAYSLGQIYRAQGKLTDAQKYAEEATVLDPVYPLAWYGAGAVYYSQAIDHTSTAPIADRAALIQKSTVMMNNAIGLNKNQTAAYVQQAVNFSLIGKFEVSFDALEKAQTVVLSDNTLSTPEKGEMIKRIHSVRDSLKALSEAPKPPAAN